MVARYSCEEADEELATPAGGPPNVSGLEYRGKYDVSFAGSCNDLNCVRCIALKSLLEIHYKLLAFGMQELASFECLETRLQSCTFARVHIIVWQRLSAWQRPASACFRAASAFAAASRRHCTASLS